MSVSDVMVALRIALGLDQASARQIAAVDINGNEKIDLSDVSWILRTVIGLDTYAGGFRAWYAKDPGPDETGVFEVIYFPERDIRFAGVHSEDVGVLIRKNSLSERIDVTTRNKRAYVFSYDGYSISQWVDYLRSIRDAYGPIGRLTIFAHGNKGLIALLGKGRDPITTQSLKAGMVRSQLERLKTEGILSKGAHILLFSCLVGQDEEFVQELANITGAWVHANKESTGDIDTLTDWSLDVVKGPR